MSDLLYYWFPNIKYQTFWFDGSKDNEICEKFNKELNDAENIDEQHLFSSNNNDKFIYLILFDQITRNISRITNKNEKRNDQKALELAKQLCDCGYDLSVPFYYRIFILLPFRHTCQKKHLDFVIYKLNQYYDSLDAENKGHYTRFYLATLKNYTNCIDNISILQQSNTQITYNPQIHDLKCEQYKQCTSSKIIINLQDNNLYKSILNYCQKYKIKKVGVSLSGGVDSMVLLFILHQLVLNNNLEKVVAIHINYNWECRNNECQEEADYLWNFCSNLNTDIILRNITHFNSEVDKRINIEREFIDEETKMIRFNTYKYCADKYNLDGICLGHHKGDLIENVFMNFAKGKNILDLFITKEYDLQHNVNILRPMLDHLKDDILNIAHENNIIYFKDTTPDWSFRGTMRKKMFPTMIDFDKMIMGNFYKMGKQSAEWGEFINNKLINPILKNTQNYKYGFMIKMNIDYIDIPISFWSELFVNLFHRNGIRMIKHTNMKSFVEWVNDLKKINNLFRLSNGYIVFKYEQNICFIRMDLYESLKINLNNEKVEIFMDSDKKEIFIGHWHITLEKINGHLNKCIEYCDLLDGHFEYTVSNSEQLKISVYEKIKNNNPFHKINIDGLNHIIPKVNPTKKNIDGNIKITMNLIF
jgi:tRNA(Ile)-lysidine synthetase-like protein